MLESKYELEVWKILKIEKPRKWCRNIWTNKYFFRLNHVTFNISYPCFKSIPKVLAKVPHRSFIGPQKLRLISNFCIFQERVACNVGGQNINTGDAKRVSPCTMCTCTKEGPLCQSLKVENCFHLAQSFTRSAILDDHVCKVQCAFAFRAFPNVRTGENRIGFS